MEMTTEQLKSRECVADLILKGSYGNNMVISSKLEFDENSFANFSVTDLNNEQSFKVTVKMEEI